MPCHPRLGVLGALHHVMVRDYLLALIRYIHLNPVRAGIVSYLEPLVSPIAHNSGL